MSKIEIKHNCKKCAGLSEYYTKESEWHTRASRSYKVDAKKYAEKCRCEKK